MTSSRSTTGIDAAQGPSKWDPRLLRLVRFVEDERNLRFDHPVDARFLTDAEYAKETSSDQAELTDADKADLARAEGELRALGLISKDASLFDDTNTITSGGTLAFYDPETEEMVIKGTELTVGLEVTIVHELTHALQDQTFDLSREFESDNKAELFRALGEGDASRIETKYIDSLSDADQNKYYDEQDANSQEAESAIGDVSPFLSQLFGAPYALGEPMTTILVKTKGDAGLNALFRNPPASDELLLSPFALLDNAKPKKIARPRARDGEEISDGGDFGSLTWYLMLAARLDEKTALAATDGWGGDSYIGYRKAGKNCVRAIYAGDTPQDTQEMTSALNQWKAAVNSPTVTVVPSADRVELDSCELDNVPAPAAGFRSVAAAADRAFPNRQRSARQRRLRTPGALRDQRILESAQRQAAGPADGKGDQGHPGTRRAGGPDLRPARRGLTLMRSARAPRARPSRPRMGWPDSTAARRRDWPRRPCAPGGAP